MKRNINTNVLNGFIKQAVTHNKYLEENEMWKRKRELENADKKPKTKRRESSSDEEPVLLNEKKKLKKDPDEIDDLQVLLALYKDSKNQSTEKWNHSGFNELYPDYEARKSSPDRSTRVRSRSRGSESSDSSDKSQKSDKKSKKRKKSKDKSKNKKSHSKHKKKKKKKKN